MFFVFFFRRNEAKSRQSFERPQHRIGDGANPRNGFEQSVIVGVGAAEQFMTSSRPSNGLNQ